MNDPALTVTPPAPEPSGEEPRSRWLDVWQKVHDLLRPPPNAEVLRDVVEELIEEPLSASGLSPAERMLLGNIMLLRERKVGECMTPRADIVATDIDNNLQDVADLMAAHAHSRIPIYRGTLDDVIGMVHMKDVLSALVYKQVRTIPDLLRPVLFVAPSMPASRLLLQMRSTRQHLAVVVDEFGGIDGLVTMEDLMEEIVGEIEDEHDTPTNAPIITRADGTLLVDARLPIEQFELQTGIHLTPLDGEDIDTLGGYVANLAGRVPHIGESFHNGGGVKFEVLEMTQGRIKRLRVRGPKQASTPAGQAKPSEPRIRAV